MKNLQLLTYILFAMFGSIALNGQEASDSMKLDTVKLATKKLPLEPTRQFQLNTTEGTWISLDVSPDGQQIVFDLLGDIYLMPITGGKAKQLIGDLSFETHPKWSPDGKMLTFTSDRSGSENIWTFDIDSSDWSQVTKDTDKHYQSAEWTPDGEYIIVAKGNRNLKLHMFHKSGGGGVQLIEKPEVAKTIEPAFGKDKRYIWMSTRRGAWNYNAQLPQYQLATFDRETGEVERKTSRYGSAFAPTLSPDGEWLVYVTRHNAKTGLVKRNLKSGEESWLAYPVQRDDQESIATLGVYPAMSFTPDSKSLVASYGGKIHKIDIQNNAAIEIPFEVSDTINYGPRVKFDYAISDDPKMEVTQIRDPKVSPDGSKIAFTALNRLYVADYPNGTPARVTNYNFTEAMPTWSADSKQLAFVSWEGKGGHIYKVDARANGTITKLTQEAGYFVFLNWDSNTDRIIFLKGMAQTFVDAIDPFYYGSNEKFSWIASSGGEIHDIDHRHGRSNPHFVKGKERIYLHDPKAGLVSIRWDGTDKKEHVKITGVTTFPAELGHSHCLMVASETEPTKKPSTASILTMDPTGKYVLAQINNEIYRVMVPMVGGKTPSINVAKPDKAIFPAEKVTDIGGEFAHWSGDGTRAYYSLGNAVFDYEFAEAKIINEALKKKKEAEKKRKAAEKKNKNKKKDADSEEDSENDAKEETEKKKQEEDEGYKATEHRFIIKVDRDIPQGDVLLSGARIVTMKGDEVLESGDILIKNNRISAVGAKGSLTVDVNTKTINLSGKTIVPGFVDVHAHMWPTWGLHKNNVWIYAANLAYGVTTTRDPQTATTDVLTYEDMVESGEIPGPRIYSTGPGIGFWSYRMKDKKHVDKVMKQYSEYYDTKTIKMYLVGNRQHRQWVIQSAKEQNIMPTTEGGLDMKLNITQLLDGYPGHEHALPIYPIYDDLAKLIAESRMSVTPTMLVAYGGPWAENYYYSRENPQYDPKLNHFTPKAELDAKTRRRPGWFMDEEHVFKKHAESCNKIVEHGGIVGVGSHGQLQGLGYHWELWSVASGGMTNLNALKVATILGAEAIGLEKELGSIEVGKLADLVILNENPLENLRNTNTIDRVMKNGRLYDGNTLDEVHPREVKAPSFFDRGDIPTSGLPGIK